MSELLELPLDNLLPIQAAGVVATQFPELYDYLVSIPPVEALLYNETEEGTLDYLLLDGHHRAYRAHVLGRTTIVGNVMIADADVRNSHLPHLIGCETIESVKDRYHTLWLPLLQSKNISSIATLPLRAQLR